MSPLVAGRRHSALRALTLLTAVTMLLGLPPAVATADGGDYQQVLDVTFPTRPDAWFSDSYDACRSGCERQHKATDLMGARMWPLYAMVDGVICRLDDGEEDSYGRHITLCGDDGREYRYLHLNNDNPGTDDGAAGLEHVFAPGIRQGLRVARGQHIAYMGDSGNAEETAPHLHLDVFDDAVVDPYGDNRINPYPSLMAALARGDIADGSVVHADPVGRVFGDDRIETAIELSRMMPVSSDVVVIARSDHPADALVAGPLASLLEAPVLITGPDALDERVADEVLARRAAEAIVVGAGIDKAVEAGLADLGLTVERLAGSDRYGTAELVADRIWSLTGAAGGHDLPSGEGLVESDAGVADTDDDAPFVLAARAPSDDEAVHLDDATVAGDVAVELLASNADAVWSVDFELDGDHVGTEQSAPFDLLGSRRRGGPRLLDSRTLDNGEHIVRARVLTPDGPVVVEAAFTVANGQSRSALLALGEHDDPARQWPDALMGSWLGSLTARPVLLTAPDGLPATTAERLADVADVTVIGGTGAIPDEVVDGLQGIRRLAGDDRYATAVAVADAALDRADVDVTRPWAATGRNWPDAITAGPVIAAHGDVLVLLDGEGRGASSATSTWLQRIADEIEQAHVVGGVGAVVEGALTAFALDVT